MKKYLPWVVLAGLLVLGGVVWYAYSGTRTVDATTAAAAGGNIGANKTAGIIRTA